MQPGSGVIVQAAHIWLERPKQWKKTMIGPLSESIGSSDGTEKVPYYFCALSQRTRCHYPCPCLITNTSSGVSWDCILQSVWVSLPTWSSWCPGLITDVSFDVLWYFCVRSRIHGYQYPCKGKLLFVKVMFIYLMLYIVSWSSSKWDRQGWNTVNRGILVFYPPLFAEWGRSMLVFCLRRVSAANGFSIRCS